MAHTWDTRASRQALAGLVVLAAAALAATLGANWLLGTLGWHDAQLPAPTAVGAAALVWFLPAAGALGATRARQTSLALPVALVAGAAMLAGTAAGPWGAAAGPWLAVLVAANALRHESQTDAL